MLNNFYVEYFSCQLPYYKAKIDEKYSDEFKLIKMKQDIKNYIQENNLQSLKIYNSNYFSISLYNEDAMNRQEKEKSKSKLCVTNNLIVGKHSHIIPKDGTKFLDPLPIPVDKIYLELCQGQNIIKTSSNLHKYMELEGSSAEKPPLFTIMPLEYIKNNFQGGVDGYIHHLMQLNILLPDNGNYLVVGDMMIIVHPKKVFQGDFQVANIIKEINSGFQEGTIANINEGEFYWLIHSTWAFYYWFACGY